MAAVVRALEVLEQLAGMRQPASLSDVAEQVKLSESQTYRVLAELKRGDYVIHVGRSGYRLGPRSVALGTLIGPRPLLVRTARPVLVRLAVTTGHATALHLRSATSRVLIFAVPAHAGPLRNPGAVLGERSRLDVGASGRVILAHLPGDEVQRIRLRVGQRRLSAIRERGYEVSDGENHPGIAGVSGPILDENDRALGSVTVAGPTRHIRIDEPDRVVAPLLTACRELSPAITALLGTDASHVLEALDL